MSIRKACEHDLSRIAEIFVLNNRINYFPIFQDEEFSFGKLQVISVADTYFKRLGILSQIYVYDDGLIRGFLQMDGTEICKLYVDPFFQSRGIGGSLIEYGIRAFGANHLWALEKKYQGDFFLPETRIYADWGERIRGRYNGVSCSVKEGDLICISIVL